MRPLDHTGCCPCDGCVEHRAEVRGTAVAELHYTNVLFPGWAGRDWDGPVRFPGRAGFEAPVRQTLRAVSA